MKDNWLKNAADLEEKLEKSEYKGFMCAYIHCKELCNKMSFTSLANGKVVRIADVEHVLNGLIEYYSKEIEKFSSSL